MNTLTIGRIVKIVAILALLPALAVAQSRRITPDPIDPGRETGGGDPRQWTAVAIRNLLPGAQLGTLWVEPSGTIYVWSTRTYLVESLAGLPRRDPIDEPPPSDPGAPTGSSTNSALLAVTGGVAQVVLDAPGETAVSVYGTDATDIYAATNLPNGSVRLYHWNGVKWRVERLPEGVTGPAGSVVGERGTMFFRAGNKILAGHERNWSVAYTNDKLFAGSELVYLDRTHLLAPGDIGEVTMNDGVWIWQDNFKVVHMDGAWGARDNLGQLHLFATGSDPDHSGLHVWQFNENGVGTLRGCYDCVCEGTVPAGFGTGLEVWGRSVHDVYAIGEQMGQGHVMYFDGVAWNCATPMVNMPVPTGITGTPNGDVWMTLNDGRLLHGTLRDAQAADPGVEIPPVPNGLGPDLVVRAEPAGMRAYAMSFKLAQDADVAIGVYSASGRHVATVDRSRRAAGTHRVYWNAQGASPGVYFCRVTAGPMSGSVRMYVGR